MKPVLFFAAMAVFAPATYAGQGGFANSGGSTSGGSGVVITGSATTPAGSLTLNCPPSGTGTCAGGNLTFASSDGSTAISAAFTSGKYAEGCSGGGKGGNVTCSFTFTGYFSGTLTVNGQAQAIIGATYQAFGTGGAAARGTTAYNSAYTPFYYSDSEQIHRADDLQGTNQISFGGTGSSDGQFYGAYGIALDSAGRIYVADTYNCRIVRIDDMNGTNWISYGGTCGSAQGQFYDPSGIALDSAGRIYVLDTGNVRIVRIDDMNGTNWISYGSAGSGAGQFAPYLTSLALDSHGRIYVADTGNKRIVRIDEMAGTNWTTLTQSAPVNGASYSLQSPAAVAIDSNGKIYIADNEYYQPAVVRVDDMTGANYTYLYTGSGGGLNSIAVDAGGSVFTGGGGAKIVSNMATVLNSSGSIGPIGSYYVFGVTPIPQPNPRPSAIGFFPSTLDFTQNVGTTGTQSITVSNFGGSPMGFGGVTASGGFSASTNCPGQILAGASCTVTVTFTPSAAGGVSGTLAVADASGNLGSIQSIAVTGTGTAPVASVTPASVTFSSQVINSTSPARNVTVQNTGTGPMQIASVTAAAPFGQTNTCNTGIAPGLSCTISVTFSPTAVGSASGTLTISGNAGTQTVNLSGSGSAPVTFSASTLSFGNLAVGSTSAPKTVTVTNRSNTSISFSSIAASTGFALGSNTCGTAIAAGGNCAVGVTFIPTAPGSVTGTLTFTDDAVTSPQTVRLNGTGSAPVTLSSSTLSFGTVTVGTTSSAKTVTLTNHESVALSVSGVDASAGFTVASNTCGTSVAAGANCSVGVTFTPAAAGPVTGTLTIGSQTVMLTGTGR